MPRPHDVVEAKHDVIEAKHDVIKAKHDVIEAKHDVICLLQFAKSFFPCLLGGTLGGGGRRRRPGYEHGGPLMRRDLAVIALIKPPCSFASLIAAGRLFVAQPSAAAPPRMRAEAL